MAIVKTEQIPVNGAQFIRKVKCSASGLFSCELPGFVSDAMGCKTPTGESMMDCLIAWGDIIEQYKDVRTEKNKIIGFTFSDEISFGEGISLSVSAAVMEETVTECRDRKKTYRYSIIDSDLDYSLRENFSITPFGERDDNQIPWTKESEEFFNNLAGAMNTLTSKLKNLSEPAAFLEFVKSGQRLLADGPSDECEDF